MKTVLIYLQGSDLGIRLLECKAFRKARLATKTAKRDKA